MMIVLMVSFFPTSTATCSNGVFNSLKKLAMIRNQIAKYFDVLASIRCSASASSSGDVGFHDRTGLLGFFFNLGFFL